MAIDLGDPLRWRESLPARQPVSSEVAAGAVAGIVGGLVAWGVAMMLLPEGEVGSSRSGSVAATLFGPFAVARGNVGPPAFVGALLVGFAAIAYGLIFVSILRPAATLRRSIGVRSNMSILLYFPASLGWSGKSSSRSATPAGQGRGVAILALHGLYGATIGSLVAPFLPQGPALGGGRNPGHAR